MTARKRYTLADLLGTVRRLLSPVEDAVREELTPHRQPEPVAAVPDYTEMDWHTYAEPLTAACFSGPPDEPAEPDWNEPDPIDPDDYPDVDSDLDTIPEQTPLLVPADLPVFEPTPPATDEPVPEEDSNVRRLMLERKMPHRTIYRKVGKGYKPVAEDAAKRLPNGTQLYERVQGTTGRAVRYAKHSIVRHGYGGCGPEAGK